MRNGNAVGNSKIMIGESEGDDQRWRGGNRMVIGQHLVKIGLFIAKGRPSKRLDGFLEEKQIIGRITSAIDVT